MIYVALPYDEDDEEAHGLWLVRVKYIIADLHWLLQLGHQRFWCQVTFYTYKVTIDSKEVEGGSDKKLCFSERGKGKVWKDYMERIMNEENYWDHTA